MSSPSVEGADLVEPTRLRIMLTSDNMVHVDPTSGRPMLLRLASAPPTQVPLQQLLQHILDRVQTYLNALNPTSAGLVGRLWDSDQISLRY